MSTTDIKPMTSTTVSESSSSSGSSFEGSSSSTGALVVDDSCPNEQALLACWDMGGVADGYVRDGSGNSLDAIAINLGSSDGPNGRVGRFDASTHVEVLQSEVLDAVDAVTIDAWIRIDPKMTGTDRQGIFDHQFQYAMFWYPDQGLRCSGTQNVFVPRSAIELGAWHHVACVFEDGAVRGVVDGVVEAEIDSGNELGIEGEDVIAIGNNSPEFDAPFLGEIGLLRVWSRALSIEELAAL